jgi:hypothetical protein
MGNKVVTSVKIDEEKWKEAKKKAIDDGTTFSDILDEALDEWLRKKRAGK